MYLTSQHERSQELRETTTRERGARNRKVQRVSFEWKPFFSTIEMADGPSAGPSSQFFPLPMDPSKIK